MRYTCGVCGTLTDQPYCPDHRHRGTKNTGWSVRRNRNKQRRFRSEVMARAAGRCERCGATTDLRACHYPIPLRAYQPDDPSAYDARNGMALCVRCDRATDIYAR